MEILKHAQGSFCSSRTPLWLLSGWGCRRLGLRQFQVKRVDLVGTHVTHQESRIVGSEASPGPSTYILQSNEEFRASLSYFHTAKVRIFRGGIVVIDVPSVPRPSRKADGAGFVDPVCPFLRLEVVEQKFLGISGESRQMLAIRRPAGRIQILRAGNCRNLS